MQREFKVVLFDFGGILAEEGFHQGLRHIGRTQGKDPEAFFQTAVDSIFETGYLVGRATEAQWWEDLRQRTGIHGDDAVLRKELLERFVLRPRMYAVVDAVKAAGMRAAVLSDQTNWLDELDAALSYSKPFEKVFNSYYTGLHKRDPESFRYAVREMGVQAEEALFIDDTRRNTDLAMETGLYGLWFRNQEDFEEELLTLIPSLRPMLS